VIRVSSRRILRLPHGWTLVAVVAVVVLGLVGGGLAMFHKPTPPRVIAIFDSGVPGSEEALAALDFAKSAKIDVVINYSSTNEKPGVVKHYLDDAQLRGVKVALSLKDLLGGPKLVSDPALDQDPGNLAMHQLYGKTPDNQVRDIVSQFDHHPAVWGYFISDELPQDPTGPEDSSKWLKPLQDRQSLIKSLTEKPTLTAMYWGDQREAFLEQVKTGTDGLMVDYYPYPDTRAVPGKFYGTVENSLNIGQTLQKVAGDNSWFGLQGFSWQAEADTAANFTFGAKPPAPNAKWMVYMAQLALQGGAHNLAFFSYEYAQSTPGQLEQIKLAVEHIRGLPEFGN